MGEQLWWALAGVLCSCGLSVSTWALFWDRSRGRRRCPACWYDMAGTPGLGCPECGRVVRSERRLLGTRRRWRRATLGIVFVVLAWVAFQMPLIRRDGWLAPVPTRVILELLPPGGIDGALGVELQRRLGVAPRRDGNFRQSTSVHDHIMILRYVLGGSLLARPVSDRWKDSYGALIRRFNSRLYWRDATRGVLDRSGGEAAPPELVKAVDDLRMLPPVLRVRTRDRWPVGLPILVEIAVEHWWPTGVMDEYSTTWSANGGAARGKQGGRGYCTLEVPLDGEVALELEVEVLQEDYMDRSRNRDTGLKRHFSLHYTAVQSIDEVIPPTVNPMLDALLASEVEVNHRSALGLWSSMGPEADGVGFGVFADVMDGSELVATYRIRWLGGKRGSTTSMVSVPAPGDWQAALARMNAGAGQPGWTVRLRPDPIWALYELDATSYWNGKEVTLPLSASR